jgi:hypothetical protein
MGTAMSRKFTLAGVLCLCGITVALTIYGCQNNGRPSAAPSLFGSPTDREVWTIRCTRVEGQDYAQRAELLATMLKKVSQLDPRKVRLATDATGSTVYYGEYHRVTLPATGQLGFPPEFRRDIEFIRSLSSGTAVPFFGAQPEAVNANPTSAHPEWEATNAQSTHSLLIAVFYNTPTFTERKEATEQYVELLRKDGFVAYYYHEPVRSFVYVGNFNQSDIQATPEGPRIGPRVEQLIAQRPEEFRHFHENGHVRYEAGDKSTAPFARLIPLPRKDGLSPAPEPSRPRRQPAR